MRKKPLQTPQIALFNVAVGQPVFDRQKKQIGTWKVDPIPSDGPDWVDPSKPKKR